MSGQRGQVMLLTVLILSGTLLGATTIAGLLMLYQIRQSADIANSTRAIYAADSGLERRIYEFRILEQEDVEQCSGERTYEDFLDNGIQVTVGCEFSEAPTGKFVTVTDAEGNSLQVETVEQSVRFKATGEARNNFRALQVTFLREIIP